MDAESVETWGTTQLYHLIQRAAQQAEGIHAELQKRCKQQQLQISMLTEEHEQLRTEKGNLQEQLETVTRIFPDVWPTVMANNNQIPEGIKENDIVEHSVHIRVACLNIHKENEKLRAALAT